MNICTIDGRRIEYVRLPSSHPRSGAPAMVFLHEGLGSLSMWRDFPQQLADACGCELPRANRAGRGLLWFATATVAALLAFPYLTPFLF